MNGIEFVDLPEDPSSSIGKGRILRDFADELRKNPGKWAKYPFSVKAQSAMVYRLRNGESQAFPRGEFEARVHNGDLFVRAVTA
jgi:hypothetical protein